MRELHLNGMRIGHMLCKSLAYRALWCILSASTPVSQAQWEFAMRRARLRRGAKKVRRAALANPGTVFERVLSGQEVDEECRWLGHEWRKRVFTPLVTLWTFLSQVLSADGSCRDAVARVLTFLGRTTGLTASHDPSSYCTARKRLPMALLPRLTRRVAGKLAGKVQARQLWRGHRVWLVDGTSVQMPDTAANQAAYPQPSCQKPGCGFPVARVVALFDLITGAVWDAVLSSLSVGEVTLARRLWPRLEPGDIVVGDSQFCTYADIALLRAGGVHAVFRVHVARKVDLRKARRLGPGDWLVTWRKEVRPPRMPREVFEALAGSLCLRIVRFRCRVPGWRSEEITVVTTLLDPQQYSRQALAKLFHRRWDVETDLAHLKTTMGMELLRTKSPDMVHRELWAHLLAYNLIRTLMWDAGTRRRVDPLRLSYKATIQELFALWPFTATDMPRSDLDDFYDALIRAVGFHRLPERPHRHEPRVRKRRPKNYPVMGASRSDCKKGQHGRTA